MGTKIPPHNFIHFWADKFLELERYFKYKEAANGRDPLFLSLLGDSVYRFGVYNNALLRMIQSREIDEPVGPQFKKLFHFFEFHNDLVISKIKHFFFKELPNHQKNELFFKVDRDFYELGKKLWDRLSFYRNNGYLLSDTTRIAGRYFFLSGLVYAFIFDSYEDQGVFLHFQYNKRQFDKISKMILKQMEGVTDEKGFRKASARLLPDVLNLYMRECNAKEVNENDSVRRVYANFVKCFANEQIDFVEPLTWHLFDLVGKLDGLIQDSLEFSDPGKKSAYERKIIDQITEFIKNSLQLYESFYQTNRMDFAKLYDLESTFINDTVFDVIFKHSSYHELENVFRRLENEFSSGTEISFNLKDSKSRMKERLIETKLSRLSGKSEKNVKAECLIEEFNGNELLSILCAYAELCLEGCDNSDKTAIIGFYSSGVFLAHAVNILYRFAGNLAGGQKKIYTEENKASVFEPSFFFHPVWMFKVYPYIALHPLHDKNGFADRQNILILDESVKTGFTFSIFESYLEREESPVENLRVVALFEHEKYQRIETLRSPDIIPLFRIRNNNDLKAQHDLKNPGIFDFNGGTDILDKITDCINVNGRLDYTTVISETQSAMAVAVSFCERILRKIKETGKNRVFLYSPSPEGRVLSLLTGLFLKLKNVSVSYQVEAYENSLTVLIDLTLVTGFTAAHHWNLYRDSKNSSSRNLESRFDLLLSLDRNWFG